MKTIKLIATITAFFTFGLLNAQEQKEESSENKELSKTAYYQKRAKEDAKFEQQYEAKSKKEEKKFWKEQKAYEQELKKKDKEAYEAYMQGKRDAYAEHHNHCDSHCHHGYYYNNHTRYYYSYEYRSQPRYRTRTSVRVGVPRVRIGLF